MAGAARRLAVESRAAKGSSGGGLFDRCGDLIISTSSMWIGENQRAQARNFATVVESAGAVDRG